MEYLSLERATDAFQQPITSERIQALCRRAFGNSIQVELAHELSGGLSIAPGISAGYAWNNTATSIFRL